MKILVIIPARLDSKRLPRKLLLSETGKPLIQHVIERCSQSVIGRTRDDLGRFNIVVMSRDPELLSIAGECGAAVWLCIREYLNGTSRATELFEDCAVCLGWDVVCIVQADYPEIHPELIDQVISELERHPEWDCATAAEKLNIANADALQSADRVKVLLTPDGMAADFTRHPLYDLRLRFKNGNYVVAGPHVGIYAYRRDALLRYAAAGPCEREVSESLEQLRALHLGMRMGVVLTGHAPAGIDTREDYEAFVARWKAKQ